PHPPPPPAGASPAAEQGRDSLGSYADRCGRRPRLRFRSEVLRVARPAGAARGFVVTVRQDDGQPATHAFDFVAVCNGTFSIPQVPHIAGLEAFTGQSLHSSQLTNPALIAGRPAIALAPPK